MIYYTNEGKTYAVVGTTDGTISSASDVVIVNFKANTQTYFTAPAGGHVLVSDNAAIITPVFKLAPAALVGQSGAGADSGGSSDKGSDYLEYTFAEDGTYSVAGQLPNLINGTNLFYNNSNLTSFSTDLPNITTGNYMFNGCTKLTSFNSDLSSLTSGSTMFYGCKLNLESVQNIANTIKDLKAVNKTDSIYISMDTTLKSSDTTAPVNVALATIRAKGWTVSENYK